jgi:hypothetical protein
MKMTYGCPEGTPIGHVRRFAPHCGMQKELLSSDEKITCTWIKKHPERVVKYYFYSRPQILSRDLSNGKLEFKFFNLNRRQNGKKITEK